jgi:hypothetical protein
MSEAESSDHLRLAVTFDKRGEIAEYGYIKSSAG